jgi:hypothetical protein
MIKVSPNFQMFLERILPRTHGRRRLQFCNLAECRSRGSRISGMKTHFAVVLMAVVFTHVASTFPALPRRGGQGSPSPRRATLVRHKCCRRHGVRLSWGTRVASATGWDHAETLVMTSSRGETWLAFATGCDLGETHVTRVAFATVWDLAETLVMPSPLGETGDRALLAAGRLVAWENTADPWDLAGKWQAGGQTILILN